MINHQLLQFDANGHIMCSLGVPPTDFNGGTPMKDGLLCLADVPPKDYLGGWSYDGTGCACSIQGLNPVNGPIADDGRLAISVANTGINHYWCGLPFLTNGRLAVSFGVVPPPLEFAFSNAFGAGFDSPNAP
jgi:hypothetical protein